MDVCTGVVYPLQRGGAWMCVVILSPSSPPWHSPCDLGEFWQNSPDFGRIFNIRPLVGEFPKFAGGVRYYFRFFAHWWANFFREGEFAQGEFQLGEFWMGELWWAIFQWAIFRGRISKGEFEQGEFFWAILGRAIVARANFNRAIFDWAIFFGRFSGGRFLLGRVRRGRFLRIQEGDFCLGDLLYGE